VKYAAYWIQVHNELVNISEECKKQLLTRKRDTAYVNNHRGPEELWKSNMCLTITGLLE
jgi:hypothetical protein